MLHCKYLSGVTGSGTTRNEELRIQNSHTPKEIENLKRNCKIFKLHEQKMDEKEKKADFIMHIKVFFVNRGSPKDL